MVHILSIRSTTICVGRKTSAIILAQTGCPQGSSLSNLLFLMMLNDLPQAIKNGKAILFADDSNLVIIGRPSDPQKFLNDITDDLLSVELWVKQNRMVLNVSKTKLLILAKTKH